MEQWYDGQKDDHGDGKNIVMSTVISGQQPFH